MSQNRKVAYSMKEIKKMKKREYLRGQHNALNVMSVIPMMVLRDLEGYGQTRMARYWDKYGETVEAYNAGYFELTDVIKTLNDEVGIDITLEMK